MLSTPGIEEILVFAYSDGKRNQWLCVYLFTTCENRAGPEFTRASHISPFRQIANDGKFFLDDNRKYYSHMIRVRPVRRGCDEQIYFFRDRPN